jgi:hypothetical protein
MWFAEVSHPLMRIALNDSNLDERRQNLTSLLDRCQPVCIFMPNVAHHCDGNLPWEQHLLEQLCTPVGLIGRPRLVDAWPHYWLGYTARLTRPVKCRQVIMTRRCAYSQYPSTIDTFAARSQCDIEAENRVHR